MTQRQVVIAGAALAVLCVLSVFAIDSPVASMLQPMTAGNRALVKPFIDAVELVFLFGVSKFAFAGLILLASAVLFAFARWRGVARLLLFVGLAQFTTRLIAGVLKNVFLRARPIGDVAGPFFVENGSSFPSGHAAHFWGPVASAAIAALVTAAFSPIVPKKSAASIR